MFDHACVRVYVFKYVGGKGLLKMKSAPIILPLLDRTVFKQGG